MTPALTPLEQAILEALKQGDKNRGDFYDATAKPYPEIVPALESLKNQGLIESYFTDSYPAVLTYRLLPQPQPGLLAWFQRE